MRINLLVLRCKDIEANRTFYENLGFVFAREQHGRGPLHYSSSSADFVLELYPLRDFETVSNCRLGFSVQNIQQVLKNVRIESEYKFWNSKIFVVVDPDGRKVELSSAE